MICTQNVPAEILVMIEERDDLRKQDSASPRLSTMNDEITKETSDNQRDIGSQKKTVERIR